MMNKEEFIQLLQDKKYKTAQNILSEMNDMDTAAFLEELDAKECALAFRLISKEKAANVFSCMSSKMQTYLVDMFSETELKELLDDLYMDDTVDMVLYKLEKEGLLDDEAFACEWAATRARHQIGRGRILRELVHKGVSRDVAERAVDALDREEGDAAALALAQKLLHRYAGEPDAKKAMAKLMAAMARRGYDFESARRALEQALEEAQGE